MAYDPIALSDVYLPLHFPYTFTSILEHFHLIRNWLARGSFSWRYQLWSVQRSFLRTNIQLMCTWPLLISHSLTHLPPWCQPTSHKAHPVSHLEAAAPLICLKPIDHIGTILSAFIVGRSKDHTHTLCICHYLDFLPSTSLQLFPVMSKTWERSGSDAKL